MWATVTLLEFNRLEPPAKADINIRYDIFWHGDNFPFDGYGGSLAHAFFPEYGGDVHFDDNEIWTSGTYHGMGKFLRIYAYPDNSILELLLNLS